MPPLCGRPLGPDLDVTNPYAAPRGRAPPGVHAARPRGAPAGPSGLRDRRGARARRDRVRRGRQAPPAGRDVALKQIVSGDPHLDDRFLAEARVMASLDHPNIVRLYDFVEVEGHLVLVMERLFGGTVNSQGPLPPQTACAYVVAACAGLQYAHERGILHRDVKPQNLLLSAEGVPESRRLRDREAAQRQGHDAARHGPGHAAYIAPEQINARHAHAGGRRLRGGRRALRAALGRRAAVPAAGQPRGGVPAAHQARARAAARARAVPAGGADRDHRAALRRDPAERYASAAELAAAVAASGRRGVARPTAPRHTRRAWTSRR